MIDERVRKLARVLVRYCRNVKRGQSVQVAAPAAAEPLALECIREIYRAGGHPMVRMTPDRAGEVMYAEASRDQLEFVARSTMAAAREADHSIRILAETNTQAHAQVDVRKQVAVEAARRKLLNLLLKKNEWTLTLYPTAAYAQDAGMGVEEFADFAYMAMRLDKKDPVAAWKKARTFQAKVIRRLRGADRVRIVAPDTDLVMSVKGRTFINSFGSHNMPDGEVFTGPVESTAEGHIRYTYPACYRGKEVADVRLEFEKGKVVKATAGKNEAFLKQMIGMDAGASRLGELGIGTNYDITRFIKNILFDEKIGGTVHLALGKGYPETGSKAKSALHWDMICDLRDGGRMEVDGKALQEEGTFKL